MMAAFTLWTTVYGLQLHTPGRPCARHSCRAVSVMASDSVVEPEVEKMEYQVWLEKAKSEENSFMKMLYSEQAEKAYKRENPDYMWDSLVQKYSGPLTTFVIVGLGFYSLPVFSSLIKAVMAGYGPAEILGSVAQSIN